MAFVRNFLAAVATAVLVVACAEAPQRYENVYSRPNDDTFQNAQGNAGEPYEVARLHTALVVDAQPEGIDVAFEWKAIMVTGRHVEAGRSFRLVSVESDLGDRSANAVRLSIRYPKGVGADSLADDKKGSELHATLPLGTARSYGRYHGTLVVQRIGETATETRHFAGGGPKNGVFQTIRWSFELGPRGITNVDLDCRRVKDPNVRLVSSNFVPASAWVRPYPAQPKAAVCEEEKVGEGDPSTEAKVKKLRIAKEMGALLKTAGCLDCHDRGSRENSLFCDDGVAIHGRSTYAALLSVVNDPTQLDRTTPEGKNKYPKGMKDAFHELKTSLTADERRALQNLVELATK